MVVDHEISSRQARNLKQATGVDVIDRTGVIVEIFHRHAQTREARLQVEIARLTYVVPRLRAGARGADRQRGGVGGKGAGESALELDRRKVRDRVAELRTELAAIERDDELRRSRRARPVRRVGLVGWRTNAREVIPDAGAHGQRRPRRGQALRHAGHHRAALQPDVRPRILVLDTVGFIRHLPHHLVASFRSTLDEALEACCCSMSSTAPTPASAASSRSRSGSPRQHRGRSGREPPDPHQDRGLPGRLPPPLPGSASSWMASRSRLATLMTWPARTP
ncbi:MAG: hypothetical protein R3F43_11695 [bacterium]